MSASEGGYPATLPAEPRAKAEASSLSTASMGMSSSSVDGETVAVDHGTTQNLSDLPGPVTPIKESARPEPSSEQKAQARSEKVPSPRPEKLSMPLIVHTSTPGGMQEKHSLVREATVLELRRRFRFVQGKQYKLLTSDGREMGHQDLLSSFLDEKDGVDLYVTKVRICHPIDLDVIQEMEPTRDAFHCDVFQLDVLQVSIGTNQKFSKGTFTAVNIDEPQKCFNSNSKLEPYKLGYDYYETFETNDKGEGRSRSRILPERKTELEQEFKERLKAFRHLHVKVFENPSRICKFTGFMDQDEFPPTKENLYQFLNVFFDLLTDKAAILL